jgi:DNA mismatch endonuclease (patch repair protein)
MDVMSKEQRSRNMSLIKSKNTKPEVIVRKYLFGKGLRYRINYSIPGTPDIVFQGRKIAIFIHGCFWHLHGCKYSTIPKTNTAFWKNKLLKNRKRDRLIKDKLTADGWNVYIIWECELKDDRENCLNKLLAYIKPR